MAATPWPRATAVVPDGPRRAAQPRRRAGPGRAGPTAVTRHGPGGRRAARRRRGRPATAPKAGLPADGARGRPAGDGAQGRPPADGARGRPAGDGAQGRPPADGARGRPAGDGARGRPPADGARGWQTRTASGAGARPARAGDETGTRLDIPAEITADQLDPAAAAELRTLPADLAAAVARRLVAASLAEDPETSYQLAREAEAAGGAGRHCPATAGIVCERVGQMGPGADRAGGLGAAADLVDQRPGRRRPTWSGRRNWWTTRWLVLAEPQAGQVPLAHPDRAC